MQRAKRWLFLIHRWLGIALGVFFAMWFVSGVVMMYVGYPKLTERERLAQLPVLRDVALSPRQALDAAGITGPLQDLRLAVASGGRAVYLAVPAAVESSRQTAPAADAASASATQSAAASAVAAAPPPRRARPAKTVVIDANTGVVLGQVTPTLALASAAAFASDGVSTTYVDTIDEDAFTHSRGLDAHRPLHRVQLDDAASTLLYISGSTGEVVRDAPRAERLWNYAGAWIHWLYPFRGGALNAYWTDIVNWLSIVGIAVILTGTIVGIMRWRFTRRYKSGSRSPYPSGMMRWHHISGLLFAAITLTWMFSGLMSMNPWRIFDAGAPALKMADMNGSPLLPSATDATPANLLLAAHGNVRELRWVQVAGQSLVLARHAGGKPVVLDAGSGQAINIDPERLKSAAAKLVAAPVARVEVLTAYDLYYYARVESAMMGGGYKPLPIWRVVFDDKVGTWVHLDPHTGAVLDRSDSHRRTSRWLFAMLHSWDWLPLLERRPIWDVLMVVLSLGGAVLSLTSVVIGWRRLGRKLKSGQTPRDEKFARGAKAGRA
ncbi:PepSY domain-containing protein [Pigmentiphaga aceris]|uniref:PepSY domain-containing protein n=1 Tax=Pigmentiphaga aceris TaxID=1940612 RepID=A0A5C0B1D2_9BURK|nr:PepSY domain-containing protein [Pigmentiphaga aceris]QEI07684.1 PepSY domain-containing protein [Pigmentiphaga aceris]